MEIIRSWEFDRELLNRDVCMILKIYAEFLRRTLPSVDDIDFSVQNLNRQILASQGDYSEEQIDDIYEELESQGQFACMWQFIENIIEKYNLSMEIRADYIFGIKDFGDLENAVCIINDCQNILGPNQIVSDGIEAQGTEIIQILEKRDNILKLEA